LYFFSNIKSDITFRASSYWFYPSSVLYACEKFIKSIKKTPTKIFEHFIRLYPKYSMDSFTQIVLGAGVGELVLGKKVGNKAMLWGAVAGTIPDLDVFYRFFTDPLNAMLNHRGFMHSIVFCALFAPVLGWIISKLYKSKEAS
jgi:hypothetical protein